MPSRPFSESIKITPEHSGMHGSEPSPFCNSSAKSLEVRYGLPTAVDIARYLIQLAASETEPEFLTHMRLQKLLYYVQGWSLALRSRPAFFERIEAWAHGPVVKSVYPEFASFGDQPIPNEDVPLPQGLLSDDPEFINAVWEAYKGYSATSLRTMTHEERPWRDARGNCDPADRCDSEITQEALRTFFREVSQSRGQAS